MARRRFGAACGKNVPMHALFLPAHLIYYGALTAISPER
jgi:hypothetical protein